jgi:CRP-like cAMP-binding protein
MELEMINPEIKIVTQGDVATAFYIIAKGECKCLVQDSNEKLQMVRTLYPGQQFGEVALLTGNKRTATV